MEGRKEFQEGRKEGRKEKRQAGRKERREGNVKHFERFSISVSGISGCTFVEASLLRSSGGGGGCCPPQPAR